MEILQYETDGERIIYHIKLDDEQVEEYDNNFFRFAYQEDEERLAYSEESDEAEHVSKRKKFEEVGQERLPEIIRKEIKNNI